MNALPAIQADLRLLSQNARTVADACRRHGVALSAVTKAVCADPHLSRLLAASGAASLADSRVENLRALPDSLPRLSLRVADPAQAEELVTHAQQSLQSTPEAILALGEATRGLGRRHAVILMVDLGDLREGVYHREVRLLQDLAALTLSFPSLELLGVGANLTCFGGILPDEDNLGRLVALAEGLRRRFDIPLPLVSGGNSSSLHLLFEGRLPRGVNHLRVGEGLLLGMDTATGNPFPHLSQHAFTLFARLVEIYEKPSRPEGRTGPNAFGEAVSFPDLGPMRRGILAVGRQDTDEARLTPTDPAVRILGASSDHLLVDLTRAGQYTVGDTLGFTPGYGALLRAYTSPYVRRVTAGD